MPQLLPVAKEFERRAILYEAIHLGLRRKTGFFAAASLTNRVMAKVSTFTGTRLISYRCLEWLADLSAVLEARNRGIANAIECGWLTGPNLDERIVAEEQTAVQTTLHLSERATGCAMIEVRRNLDALVNPSLWVHWHFCPWVRWYARILASARNDLKLPLCFSAQAHREKIGMALIGELRGGSR